IIAGHSLGAGIVDATVEELIRIPRPPDMTPPTIDFPNYQGRRRGPVEMTVWRIEAQVIALKQEQDGDYHLVLQGASGQTMVAEGDLKLGPTFKTQVTPTRVRVTGVGFFDKIHGQMGVSLLNGIELHPILKIEWI